MKQLITAGVVVLVSTSGVLAAVQTVFLYGAAELSDSTVAEGVHDSRGDGEGQSRRADDSARHRAVPPFVSEQYINPQLWEPIDRDSRRWSQKQLGRLAVRAKNAGGRVVGLFLEGDPAQQITRAARSKRTDLLVVGTQRSSRFSDKIRPMRARRLAPWRRERSAPARWRCRTIPVVDEVDV